ncbi:hypothetical protein KR009_004803, partial [Drosophila setifemur]
MAQDVVWQPYPRNCQRYYEIRLRSCQSGFQWNPRMQRCEPQTLGVCSSLNPRPITATPPPTPTPPPTSNAPNLSTICDHKMGQLIAYPGDCSRFIQCDYLPFVKICPEYLFWNAKLLTCDKICV